jgi:hypothetical protein
MTTEFFHYMAPRLLRPGCFSIFSATFRPFAVHGRLNMIN